jgi:hypothetical protein
MTHCLRAPSTLSEFRSAFSSLRSSPVPLSSSDFDVRLIGDGRAKMRSSPLDPRKAHPLIFVYCLTYFKARPFLSLWVAPKLLMAGVGPVI